MGKLITRESTDGISVQQILAAVRHIQTPDDVHESGFAASGWAHNRNELTCLHAKRHVVKRVDLLAADHVRLGNIVH